MWQPIETAPNSFDEILCFAPANKGAWNENARQNQWRVDHKQTNGRFYKMLPEAPYTHWMPLPPPPTE